MDSYQPTRESGSFDVTSLINPPPQVFGPYASGSPTNPIFPRDYFGEEQNGATVEESNEAKRRRIARVKPASPQSLG